MANPEHLEILKRGVKEWNAWREANRGIVPDLSGQRIENENLGSHIALKINTAGTGFDYADAIFPNFDKVNFSNAYLTHINFSGSNLRGANFNGAQVYGADFVNADLRWMNLRGTYLYSTNFFGAQLEEADFAEAVLEYVSFGLNDLRRVKGLETVIHRGRSNIGIDTIYKSEGNIPEKFLRGCGVPESFIVQMRALVASTDVIQFYSCFISYSSKDEDFANRLYADLQNRGVRCWFAPEDLKIGDRFRSRIDESIRVYDKLLLVLSENSVSSQWVEKEVETALEREREQNKTMLFPVRLDDAVNELKVGWPADVRRTRHVGDFTHWKDHDSYQKAFDRLLRDLKADDK